MFTYVNDDNDEKSPSRNLLNSICKKKSRILPVILILINIINLKFD